VNDSIAGMKPIEVLIRNDKWDRATQAKFYAHLEKPMQDDHRVGYCERKAFFLAGAGKLAPAIALLEWALATYDSTGERAGYARAQLGDLRRQLTLARRKRR
jgi:hypothetical protein